MKIKSKTFDEEWSWNFTVEELKKAMPQHEWKSQPGKVLLNEAASDVILCQQITLMTNIIEKDKTICRLGGNRSFDEDRPTNYDKEIAQTYAIIATNKKLFDIAKKFNPNTFLIPNGLNLEKWRPVKCQADKFTAGFSGNIRSETYREYKGFDYYDQACKLMKVVSKTALFRSAQIPHEEMRDKFYSQISVLVHPSKGEGCSNVVMEALACAVPVITTREAGYHGESLEDGKNVLFCERTVESITKCLRRMKINKRLRESIGENGRAFAEQHHDINIIAKQYDAIFQACHAAYIAKTVKIKTDTERLVDVKVLEGMYEEGNRKTGDVFQTTFLRAKQLGNSVEIING